MIISPTSVSELYSREIAVLSSKYRWLIFIAWLFVLTITLFDIRWAVLYRETARYWESNPIQRWVIMQYGVWVAGVARFSTILFAALLMPIAPRRSQIAATLTAVSAHAYLAVTYALIFMDSNIVFYQRQ